MQPVNKGQGNIATRGIRENPRQPQQPGPSVRLLILKETRKETVLEFIDEGDEKGDNCAAHYKRSQMALFFCSVPVSTEYQRDFL